MREVLNKDKENERPKYAPMDNKNAEGKMFDNIEDASSFWILLWKSQGTGNRNAQWLEDIRSAIYSRVLPPSENTWKLDTTKATKVLARKKNWSAESIRFLKGLPQGDTLCPRLFTVCVNPIAWKISASEGYKLSKPNSAKVTDLLYIDDLKICASSESKLNRVMESTNSAIEDVGLQWNPKKCAVAHVQRGVHTHTNDALGLRINESIYISNLEECDQDKSLGVLESVRQEERMSLDCAAREFLRRMSIICSSALSDHNRVTASNQFALPVLGYLMWTQQWPVTELKRLDREARKTVVENGGKHPSGSSAILYVPREKGGRGLRSIEKEYKVTKIKVTVKLYRNGDPGTAMVRESEERAEKLGHSSLVKEASRYAEEMGLQLQIEYPNPTCIKHDSEDVITAEKLKAELRRGLEQKIWEVIHEQSWHGRLTCMRREDMSPNFDGCL